MPDTVRTAALVVLNAMEERSQRLDRMVEKVLSEHVAFSKRDRAFLHTLVYGVFRWRGNLDWYIGHFSKTRLKKISPEVLNVLRLGTFQIVHLDKIPHSAAVNTSVEMAKTLAPSWVVRYTNGVLRNIARGYHTVPFPDDNGDPAHALSVKKAFPGWLVEKWIARFGRTETGALCDIINTIPPITLRTNTLKTSREILLKSLAPHVERIMETPRAPAGISLFNPKSAIPGLGEFQEGGFQVQDEAAQLVGHLVDPQPGETILDGCAGLGGKTGHLAQLMKNSGKVVALDQEKEKLKQLCSEMKRLGISIVSTVRHDLNRPVDKRTLGLFDRILLDAPCSGLGVIRRHPDAKWRSAKKNLAVYQKRQLLFLDRLTPLLKPSGVLVYAVCSMEPEETDGVVQNFIARHDDVEVVGTAEGIPPHLGSLMDTDGCLRTYPHRDGMDGFFSVRFRKKKKQ